MAPIFQKGLNTFKKGEYDIALREWTTLARQGIRMPNTNWEIYVLQRQRRSPKPKNCNGLVKRAAERGNKASQNNLGYMIGSGFGSIEKRRDAVVKVRNNYPVKNVVTITRHGSSASNIGQN